MEIKIGREYCESYAVECETMVLIDINPGRFLGVAISRITIII